MTPANEGIQISELLGRVRPPQGSPPIRGWLINLGADEAGDKAVFITALLDDATPDDEWTSAKLEPIAELARAAIRSAGLDRWPYVRFARLSEAGGADPDRPEWKAAG